MDAISCIHLLHGLQSRTIDNPKGTAGLMNGQVAVSGLGAYLWQQLIEATNGCRSHPIQWTPNTMSTFVEDMRVNHCSFNIRMTKQFLNSTNVVAIFKQMRGKAMSECMACIAKRWAAARTAFCSPLSSA
jgi:hypothetical protein